MSNILLTGKPKSGKTTLLNKLIATLPNKVGLVTNEVRNETGRTGFEIVTHTNKRALLAHIDFHTSAQVGRYGVNVDNLEKLLPEISVFKDEVLYLDEIGQMELLSEPFKNLAKAYLDSKNVCLATFTSVYEDDFTRSVRNRDDSTFYEVTEQNRDNIYQEILKKLPLWALPSAAPSKPIPGSPTKR